MGARRALATALLAVALRRDDRRDLAAPQQIERTFPTEPRIPAQDKCRLPPWIERRERFEGAFQT